MKRPVCFVLAAVLGLSLMGCSGPVKAASSHAAVPVLSMAQSENSEAAPRSSAAIQPQNTPANAAALLNSYYAAQGTPVFEYFQNRKIQEFLIMWVEEAVEELENPSIQIESFAKFEILDHDMAPATREGQQLYHCTFTDETGRFGYIVFAYDDVGPSIQNFGVRETTPHQYDLRPNLDEIVAALEGTDIDRATAAASRVSWLDTAHNRSDAIIRITDEKGGEYVCSLGEEPLVLVKQ